PTDNDGIGGVLELRNLADFESEAFLLGKSCGFLLGPARWTTHAPVFFTKPPLQKPGGETCTLGVWGWRSCLGLRREKKAAATVRGLPGTPWASHLAPGNYFGCSSTRLKHCSYAWRRASSPACPSSVARAVPFTHVRGLMPSS